MGNPELQESLYQQHMAELKQIEKSLRTCIALSAILILGCAALFLVDF
jgi:hypothetical protein